MVFSFLHWRKMDVQIVSPFFSRRQNFYLKIKKNILPGNGHSETGLYMIFYKTKMNNTWKKLLQWKICGLWFPA
jgi:hypothetical protein